MKEALASSSLLGFSATSSSATLTAKNARPVRSGWSGLRRPARSPGRSCSRETTHSTSSMPRSCTTTFRLQGMLDQSAQDGLASHAWQPANRRDFTVARTRALGRVRLMSGFLHSFSAATVFWCLFFGYDDCRRAEPIRSGGLALTGLANGEAAPPSSGTGTDMSDEHAS